MTIPPFTSLWAKYEEYADYFITHVNAVDVTLVYKNEVNTSAAASVGGDGTQIITDEYGNSVPVTSLNGGEFGTQSNIILTPRTEVIRARVYWDSKDYDKRTADIKVQDPSNILKLITYAADAQKLREADWILVQEKKLKIFRDPCLYGLGPNKQYARSYWVMFDG